MEIPFNQPVKIIAWNRYPENDTGEPFGTCLTVMDDGVNVKLMRTVDTEYLSRTIPPFDPDNQFFTLVPAPNDGFRIVSRAAQKCIDFGDWFYNSPNSRTNVRHLVLKPVDAASQTQIFHMAPPYVQGGEDCKIFASADGLDYELTPNDYPAKEWVLVTLGRYPSTAAYDLFKVQPKPIDGGVRGIRVHNTGAFLMDFQINFSRSNSRGRAECPSNADTTVQGKAGRSLLFAVGDYRTIDLASSSYGVFNPSPYTTPVEIYPYAFISGKVPEGNGPGAGHNVIYDPNSNLYAVYNCGGTIFKPGFDFQGYSSDPN